MPTNYEFPPLETKQFADHQRGVLTESSLMYTETDLVMALVNWDNPESILPHIYDTSGRSVIIKSPDQHDSNENNWNGDFAGLQIIGAGGVPDMVRRGVYLPSDTMTILPVDPTNHIKQLRDILQIKRVDRRGRVRFSYPKYAPLRGMTANHAEKRRYWTLAQNDLAEEFDTRGLPRYFVPPKLAAEGIFLNRFDDHQRNLRFQVYRVPLVPRLPSQAISEYAKYGIEQCALLMATASAQDGVLKRNLHINNRPNMDSHWGNLSLLRKGPQSRLYSTDLEGIYDCSQDNEMVQQTYKALDIVTSLVSQLDIAAELVKAKQMFGYKGEPGILFPMLANALLSGYLFIELKRGKIAKTDLEKVIPEIITVVQKRQDTQEMVNAIKRLIFPMTLKLS